MRTTDWKYNFSSLKHWDNRDRIAYIYDEFFEFPNADILCCIYSIAEVSMCNYCGFLAILKNKSEPNLILEITDYTIPNQKVFCSSSGKHIILRVHCYIGSRNLMKFPFLIIDIEHHLFSFITPEKYCNEYTIKEIDSNVFKISSIERNILLNRLKWYSFDRINSLKELVLNQEY